MKMSDRHSRHRWFVVGIFFLFMLLHQTDKLLIGPLTSPIMEEFHLNEIQMGAVSTGALIVGALFYPIWGYLYDRYARTKLLAVASFIWGATTMLNASARSYPMFIATRASTGIDDSSYPGLHSIIADYFGPEVRGKIYGFLQLTSPLGYLVGMILALMLGPMIGWRNVFYITGSLGLVLAVVIFFGVKEPARGEAEPELVDLVEMGIYKFNWPTALQLFRKPTMILLFIQGFFGVFPWQMITYWIFRYLETERNYTNNEILTTMVSVILILSSGYFIGGAVGDWAFKRMPSGRLIVSSIAVLLGAVFFAGAIITPIENQTVFLILMSIAAIFMPFAGPNLLSSVYDITLPEVRSTALSIQMFIENAGAATAPLLGGYIAFQTGELKIALLLICTSTWIICSIFYAFAAMLVPKDIKMLRDQLKTRADTERAAHAG
jgi:MFS family permease